MPQHNRTDRVVALDLLVRAHAEGGDADAAKTALAELNAIDAVVGTVPIHAAASLAAGYVALGTRDADAARRHLEDAVDLFLSGDQILKGAALNGIQIAEKWMRLVTV